MKKRRAQSGGEWYEDGLRFECTMCGACCSGPPGVVLFSEPEGRCIAGRLGITYEDFLERYTHETGEGRSINEVLTAFGYDCAFLDRQSEPGKALCSLYEDRPTQCRTFPFWPSNLKTPRAWNRLGKVCEGVGRGAFVPIEEVRVQRDRQAGAETVR